MTTSYTVILRVIPAVNPAILYFSHEAWCMMSKFSSFIPDLALNCIIYDPHKVLKNGNFFRILPCRLTAPDFLTHKTDIPTGGSTQHLRDVLTCSYRPDIPLFHLFTGTTLHRSSLSQLLVERSLIWIACRVISFPLFFCSLLYPSSRVIGFSVHCFIKVVELLVFNN